MIRIKKPEPPAFLVDPDGKWQKETREAIAYYESGATKAFEFEMYNHIDLKNALKAVFVKCAYCETVYGAGYDGDVEHFRPKGRVKEKDPQTPGYYWLANDWDNLLLSCQHCNQRRKHILVGGDKLEGYGKLDQFPLHPEDKRAKLPGVKLTDEDEARLLLNPCTDEVEKQLAYEDTEAVIVPLTPNAKTSVDVYVLRRPELVRARKERMLELFGQMAITKAALELLNRDISDDERKTLFESSFKQLINFTLPEKPYAGMCRFFVRKFLVENKLK